MRGQNNRTRVTLAERDWSDRLHESCVLSECPHAEGTLIKRGLRPALESVVLLRILEDYVAPHARGYRLHSLHPLVRVGEDSANIEPLLADV